MTGYFGESLPFGSGLTSVVKHHGHQGPGDTEYEMYLTGEKSILLIRNPYEAIYGYRHFVFNGQLGNADVSKFIGEGKYIFILSSMSCRASIQSRMHGIDYVI